MCHSSVILTDLLSWGHVNPIGPRACYDEGKRVAETLTYGFQRQDGVDVRVARIFNTYGEISPHLSKTIINSLFSQGLAVCILESMGGNPALTSTSSEPRRWSCRFQFHCPGSSR
jgi:nucleoside-diphosphate-sugar epimerase